MAPYKGGGRGKENDRHGGGSIQGRRARGKRCDRRGGECATEDTPEDMCTVVTAEDRYNTRDAFKVGDAIGAGQIDTNGQEQ